MHSGCFLLFDLLILWFSYIDSLVTCEKKIVLFFPSQSVFHFLTIWLSGIPSTKLNRSDERQQHCLVSDLKGKASGFSQLSMMLVVHFLVNNLDQVEKIPLFPSLLRILIMNWCWVLSSAFLHQLIWYYISFLACRFHKLH